MDCDNKRKYDPSISPIAKNKTGMFVRSEQRKMVINLYKEIKEQEPDIKSATLLQTLSDAFGIGKSTIKKILAEYRKSGRVSSPNREKSRKQLFDKLKDIELLSIRQIVHSFWFKREIPTLDKILQVVNNDPELVSTSRASLYRLLMKLEFTFAKRKRQSVLTEKEDLIIWRRNYLYDVRKFRKQGRPIYYLGETCISTGDCCDTVCNGITIKSEYDTAFESKHDITVESEYDTVFESKHDITVKSEYDTAFEPKHDITFESKHDEFNERLSTGEANPTEKGLNVLHIGSDKGFLPDGLMNYHEMNGENFKEWFECILPKLERNSVIVMDNVPHHSEKIEKIPTSTWKNQDIIDWLKSKGETFDRPMLKSMLLERVRQIKSKFSTYVIDSIAENAGHTILRLAPFHSELNPIVLAWSMVKQNVKQYNTTSKSTKVKHLLNESITRVTPQHWSNFIKCVIEREDFIWEVDKNMDEIIDNMEPC